MGKHHLWKKHSYVRVEKNEPGCIWALFRVLNYQRWNNVRKMLPYYKKQKPTKNKANPDDEYQISEPIVLEGYDAIRLSSASVNSSSSKSLGTLLEEEDNARKTDFADEQPQLQDDPAQLSTPTLLSLLKADLKMDGPRKGGLARSGTYPSPNNMHSLGFGRTPSKVENKHTEIWPVMSQGHELRRAKSLRMSRSSSLNETPEKFGDLFDAKTRKEMKKFPSLSEKEFTSFGDHNLHRKSFSERLILLDTDSHSYGSSEAPRLSFDIFSNMRGSRLDSPRDFDSPGHRQKLAEPRLDESTNEDSFVDEQGQSNHQEDEQQTDEVASVPASEVRVQPQQDQTENSESPLAEDSAVLSQSAPSFESADSTQGSNDQSTHLEEVIEDYNEQLEYVEHVLDVLGFIGGEDQYAAWESIDETLDPTLFDEIEILCPFKPNPSTKDTVAMSSSDRRVLFHLVIEALFEIHEKSFANYSPNSLSLCLQIRTMSKGKSRVLEDVWQFVSKYINWIPELDRGLNGLVAHDMTKTSSFWKNNQTEIEYIGLELEDLIFDELLEEFWVDDC